MRVISQATPAVLSNGKTYYGPVWREGDVSFVFYGDVRRPVTWDVPSGQWVETVPMSAGAKVTDGFFTYDVLADSSDGWLTVQVKGHRLRVLRESVQRA